MHFIEDSTASSSAASPAPTCIRQNVCTSLRRFVDCPVRQHVADLHTSKRMHFIEGARPCASTAVPACLHTSKRMHFIEGRTARRCSCAARPCIRQNVCTSLRDGPSVGEHGFGGWSCIRQNVCTSLRDALRRGAGLQDRACIRQNVCTSLRGQGAAGEKRPPHPCIRQNVCTSLRGAASLYPYQTAPGLHTSKRIHFIEGW